MNRVVEILMKRDKISEKDATELVVNTASEIRMALDYDNIDAVDDIVMDELGLEMDYIQDILKF